MLVVQVCDFGNDGDAEYRLHAPSRELGRLPGVTAIDCHFLHRHLPALADAADVLVLQFVDDWELLSLCRRRRKAGKVTVFEANDYFFDLQAWNPIAARWQDRTVQELYHQLLVSADGVQTSTVELARRWRQRGAREVAVFPNHVVELKPLPQLPNRALTVGWGGSPGHFADWYQLAPVLTRWLAARPEVNLAVMTNEVARPFVQLPPERYRFTSFGCLEDYERFLRSLDIGLAPLAPTEYNRCRSDVKFLEYASQGVPGVYSDLEPYQASVVHAETGLLSSSPAEMIEQLELLRSDAALRNRLRNKAHDYVWRSRLLSRNIGERLTWYRGLLERQSSAPEDLQRAVLDAASWRQQDYLQLRPQEPEQSLIDALRTPNKREAATKLDVLLERTPDYLAALQHQGGLLNDLRDHHGALTCLQRARGLAPLSSRTLSEIGRAWFCLNDRVRARALLDEAIQADKQYLPAWQYLLRLLSIAKAADAPDLARRAEQLFPDCYPLTLLGASLYSPAESLQVLRHVFDRLAATLPSREKPTALAAVRTAIAGVIEATANDPELVRLLRQARELFPESAWVANELGSALHRAGEFDEACVHHARALHLRGQASIHREEYPDENVVPWSWQLANHLVGHFSGENQPGDRRGTPFVQDSIHVTE